MPPALSITYILVLLSLILVLLYPFHQALRLLAAHRKAQSLGLPIFHLHTLPVSVLWQITSRQHRFLLSLLPFNLALRFDWFALWDPEWRLVGKHRRLHAKYGDMFVIVSPGNVSLEIADANVATQIMERSKCDFGKPRWPYAVLNIFGENVLSSDGATWRRHRKAVASQFTSSIHAQVWSKSVILTRELLNFRLNNADSSSTMTLISDIDSLALRILVSVAFGVPAHLWDGSQQHQHRLEHLQSITRQGKGSLQFSVSLQKVITNLTKLVVLSEQVMRIGPQSWRELNWAQNHVRKSLEHIVEEETELQRQQTRNDTAGTGDDEPCTIISKLVKLGVSSGHDTVIKKELEASVSLSKDEIVGNAFVLALAGTSSTADSLKYSIVHMAMYPDIQEWMIQDIDAAFEDVADDEWEMTALVPRLIAPLCVMMETLRHFPAATGLNKTTDAQIQTVILEDSSPFVIPPHTRVDISVSGLHFNPKYWGPRATEYRPQNWDARCECHWTGTQTADGNGIHGHPQSDIFETEPSGSSSPAALIRIPRRGSYLPWSDGGRGCLGKRFSQIEFLAVMTVIFRAYRVELAVEEGMDWNGARMRAQRVLDGSLTLPTLTMQQPVPLRFVRRDL
ncbi:cytochrome P450 [Aspergillus pseudoustus]|uniref:Cytochrome P450 n=1 Tax=Aspergillus pseudoustus TaxID=1810923 RepID=A0ABR4J0S4_9EURO